MQIVVKPDYIYGEGVTLPTETVTLIVTGDAGDTPKKVALTYLKLRKILLKGLREN